MLKLFGILILITRFEVGKKRDLWKKTCRNALLPPPNFGERTGMSRDRLLTLWTHATYSKQPLKQGLMSSVRYRWALLKDFVDTFSKHRIQNVTPSEIICVDEPISGWYGLGGNWIDIGLPNYVAIDCKPENGCEIQDSACGRSGIMMHLELVSTAQDEATKTYEEGILHGTAVLCRTVGLWARTNHIMWVD